jgi:hypothetical protein
MGPQIFAIIKAALMDPDMENLPTDYQSGLDFNIKKTSKGGYADYNTSTWARKESALTADEAVAIEQYGLYNLADFLPKQPTDVELKVMKEMFEASVDGQPYDPDRWANYYKPSGYQGGTGTDAETPAATPAPVAQARPATPAPVVAETAPWEDDAAEAADAPVVAPAKPAASSQRAEDILAMIRNRKQ